MIHGTVKPEKVGWVGGIYIIRIIQISLAACSQEDTQWHTPTSVSVCRSKHADKQRKTRGQWCHSHGLASCTESDGHWHPFEYKYNLALPSTWVGVNWIKSIPELANRPLFYEVSIRPSNGRAPVDMLMWLVQCGPLPCTTGKWSFERLLVEYCVFQSMKQQYHY